MGTLPSTQNRTLRHTSFLPKTLALAALAAAAVACGDQVLDPGSLSDSAEAEAVLRSAAALPALPALIAEAEPRVDPGTRATLERARELWVAGAAEDGTRGRARRALAVRTAVPALVRATEPARWDTVRADVEAWIHTASGMTRHLSLPEVEQRIDAAREHLARADLAAGEEARALHTVLAAGELVETTPRAVARRMTAAAESAYGRSAGGAASPDRRSLKRAERLKDWAGQAVVEEDYLLAIQRAYYALQLLEGR